MQKKTKIAFIIICCFYAFACNNSTNQTEHKTVHTFHSNGNMATETFLLDSIKDGAYKEWFPAGNLQLERNYKNGDMVSEKLYTMEGEVIKNIVIKDGRKYGLLFSSFCINGLASNSQKDSLVFKETEQ